MVEVAEFLIFFLSGYWTLDPDMLSLIYIVGGNLDKFNVFKFIVASIKSLSSHQRFHQMWVLRIL